MSRKLLIAGILMIMATNAFGQEAKCGSGRIIANGSNVKFVDSSGNSIKVYSGKFQVKAIAHCNGGVVTIFKGKDVDAAYHSPNCLNVGGGGETENVYRNGDHRNEGLVTYPTGLGVLATWRKGNGIASTYYSPDCKNIGGRGNTKKVQN